jgi:predicted DNA-binding transcriptional regulator AlpA
MAVPLDQELLAQQIATLVLEELRKGDVLMPPEFLSPRQLAQLLNVSTKMLEAMRSTRKGPPHSKIGGLVRYRLDDVRKYLEEGRVK